MTVGSSLPLRLAARLARGRALLPGALVVAVFAAFTMVMFVALSSLSLGGSQVADRDMGRFGAFIGYGALVSRPGDASAVLRFEEAARDAGAVDAQVLLFATDVQITDDPRQFWGLTEGRWVDEPFPDRYALSTGRWPERAGEVVIAAPPAAVWAVGSSVPVYGGADQVVVVGYATDEFDDIPRVLAGPGTWAELPGSIGDEFGAAGVQPVLFWAGNDTDRVTQSLIQAVADVPGATPEAVPDSLLTRELLLERPEATWLQRSPAAYQIPAILLPLLAVAVLFGANARRLRRSLGIMRAVGVRRIDAVGAAGLAVAGWALLAGLLGSLLGLGLGLALRPGLAAVVHQPAGPVNGLRTPLLTGLGVTAVAVAVGTVLLGRSLSDGSTDRPDSGPGAASGPGNRWGWVPRFRVLLGVCLLILAAAAVPAVGTAARVGWLSATLTAAVFLLLPELITFALRLLPERGPRARLARRQMLRDRTSLTAAVGLSTFLLSASLGYTVLFNSVIVSLTTINYPAVLSGQVLVQGRAPVVEPAPDSALAVIALAGLDVTGDGTPLGYSVAVNEQGQPGAFATVAGPGGTLMVLPDVAAVAGLLDGPLTDAQIQTLDADGALVWDITPGQDGQVAIDITDTAGTRLRQVSTSALPIDPPRAGWASGNSGIVLATAAVALDLPVNVGSVIFVGVDGAAIQAVDRALAASGVDVATVVLPRDPPPVIPNIGLVLTVIGVAVIAVLGAIVGTRTQLRSLRGYAAQLHSLGLSRRWVGTVLLYQTGFVAVLATILAVLIGVPPVLAAAANVPSLDLYVPYREVLAFTLTVYAATAATALITARRTSIRRHLSEV